MSQAVLVPEGRIFDSMRICIVSPISKIDSRWMQTVVNMVAFSWANGLQIHEMGQISGQVVHWARDELANQALEAVSMDGKPYTHFLWLDSDHMLPKHLACQLANNFVNPQVDMCSAVYYARNGPPLPICFVKHPNKPEHGKYTHYPLVGIPEGLCEVDAVGFGAVLMKRKVLEEMPVPRFRFDGCGEDVFFCVNAKAKGFRIFVDGSLRIGHFRDSEIVTHNEFEAYVKEHEHELGGKVMVHLGGEHHGTDV